MLWYYYRQIIGLQLLTEYRSLLMYITTLPEVTVTKKYVNPEKYLFPH